MNRTKIYLISVLFILIGFICPIPLVGNGLWADSWDASLSNKPLNEVITESHSASQNNKTLDSPVLNSSPSKFLTIDGTKTPEIEIVLQMGYLTRNADCNAVSMTGWVGGAPKVAQQLYDQYKIKAGADSFHLTVPLDKYEAGRCNWQPTAILEGMTLKPNSSKPIAFSGLVGFRNDGVTAGEISENCSLFDNKRFASNSILICRHSNNTQTILYNEGATLKLHYVLSEPK